MENKFIPDAVEIVKKAIAADEEKDYANAYRLYKRALEHFMIGLKYEKNEKSREIIMKRVAGYMSRAEQLKVAIDGAASPSSPASGAGAGAAVAKKGDKTDSKDEESSKLDKAMEGAILTSRPNVKWDDVAGLEGAKDALKEAVILPAKFPQLFTGKRRPWKGILLYGPPGTGKSYLAQAVATEAESTFFSVSSSDLVSKWQGESEKLVRSLFEMARAKKPSIIFIDEIDSLCGSRDGGGSEGSSRRIMTEFLVQMQGVGKTHDGILVLGATNTPWSIDAAMRRRFEKRVYIPLPEDSARARIFQIHLGDTTNSLTPDDFMTLGEMAKGFSGSDISVVVREALMQPLRKCKNAKFFRKDNVGKYHPIMKDPPCPRCTPDLSSKPAPREVPCGSCGAERRDLYSIDGEQLAVPEVSMEDFMFVMKTAACSVAEDELDRFIKWTEDFGEEGV